MKELTSVNNPVVKDAADLKQKKNRAEQNAFLVEGLRSVEEAVSYGTVRQLLCWRLLKRLMKQECRR